MSGSHNARHNTFDGQDARDEIARLKNDISDVKAKLAACHVVEESLLSIIKSMQETCGILCAENKTLHEKSGSTRDDESRSRARERSMSPKRGRARSRSREWHQSASRERTMRVVVKRSKEPIQVVARQCFNHPGCVIVNGVHGRYELQKIGYN
jgi:hypothetical protein